MNPKQLDALYKAFAWQNWVPAEANKALPLDSPLRSFLMRNSDKSAIAYLGYKGSNDYTLCFRSLAQLNKLIYTKIDIPADILPAELFVLATKGIIDHGSI